MGTPMGIVMDEEDEEQAAGDGFKTKKTGYAGMNYLIVGFEAPGLIYYKWDYTGVLTGMLSRLPLPFRVVSSVMRRFQIDKRMTVEEEDIKDPSDRPLNFFVGYAVPTAPGKSRIFTRTARNFFLQHPVIPRRWRNSLAKEHLAQHLVLDGDSTALHMQERLLAAANEQGVKRPESTFFMPTDADLPIRAFRKWYNSRGAGGPPWAKGVDPSNLGPTLPREEILDRMDAHTKDCSACGKAHRVSGKVKRVASGGVLLLLAAAAACPRGIWALGLSVGALTSAGVAVAMAKRQQKFVFLDYVHATRD